MLSSPCGSVFRVYLHTLCIQCKCGKIRTKKFPNTDTFHSVQIKYFLLYICWKRRCCILFVASHLFIDSTVRIMINSKFQFWFDQTQPSSTKVSNLKTPREDIHVLSWNIIFWLNVKNFVKVGTKSNSTALNF